MKAKLKNSAVIDVLLVGIAATWLSLSSVDQRIPQIESVSSTSIREPDLNREPLDVRVSQSNLSITAIQQDSYKAFQSDIRRRMSKLNRKVEILHGQLSSLAENSSIPAMAEAPINDESLNPTFTEEEEDGLFYSRSAPELLR